MNRTAIFLLAACLPLLAMPMASAGTQADPEVTDPMGDQNVQNATPVAPVLNDYTFDEVDIVASWLTDNGTHLTIAVQTNLSVSGADTNTIIEAQFDVAKTNSSVFASTANGAHWTLQVDSNFTTAGAVGMSVEYDGTTTLVSVPLASIGASGGDAIQDLTINTLASHPLQPQVEIPEDAQQEDVPTIAQILNGIAGRNANDTAPDNGTARQYNLTRGAVVPGVSLAIDGDATVLTADPNATTVFAFNVTNTGTDADTVTLNFTGPATGATATLAPSNFSLAPGQSGAAFLTVSLNGTPVGSNATFTVDATSERGGAASRDAVVDLRAIVPAVTFTLDDDDYTTEDPNATKTFTLTVRNDGSDDDIVFLNEPEVDGAATVEVMPGTFNLSPGEAATATVTVTLNDAADGDITITLSGESDNGASAEVDLKVTVDRPFTAPPTTTPAARDPILSSPAWLVDGAEALRFDDAFGDWAEVALLGVLVLVVMLIVFLMLLLFRPRWISVDVDDKKATARPGHQAEFRVTIDNKKTRHRRVKARVSGAEPGWLTQLQLQQPTGDGEPVVQISDEGELEFDLAAGDNPAGHLEGLVRVDIPDTAVDRQRADLRLDVVPLDDAGVERPKKGRSQNLTVQADTTVHGNPIVLGDITHDPLDPEEGQEVTTVASISNNSDEAWDLDIHLEVDGDLMARNPLHVPPFTTAEATFQWTAGRGNNKVKIQVFPA